MNIDKNCNKSIKPRFIILKPGFFKVVMFFFTICLITPETPAQNITRYRIQIKALDRVKIDSVKLLCKNLAVQFNIGVYILDQDNYYKIAVGEFSAFSKAQNKLEFISTFYPDAWIIPSYNDFIIFSIDPKQLTEEQSGKPPETDISDVDEDKSPIQDQRPISEPFIEEPLPVEIPEEVDEPVADPSDQVDYEPFPKDEKPVSKNFFRRFYGSGVYIDLHASDPETRYCTYYGYGAGAGISYIFSKNIAFDLSVSYSLANAVARFEKHDLSGKASVFMLNPALIAGTDFFSTHSVYGKVGAAYFNYDYDYKLELKPGYSGGPASVETELLERAVTYGLDLGIGLRVLRYYDVSFNTWFDQDSRRFYRVNLGLVF